MSGVEWSEGVTRALNSADGLTLKYEWIMRGDAPDVCGRPPPPPSSADGAGGGAREKAAIKRRQRVELASG